MAYIVVFTSAGAAQSPPWGGQALGLGHTYDFLFENACLLGHVHLFQTVKKIKLLIEMEILVQKWSLKKRFCFFGRR